MADKQPIRAVVFDLDDTLFPERQYVWSGYCAVAKRVREMTGAAPIETWLWNRFLSGQAAGAFDAMNEHFRLKFTPQGIQRLVAVYREHRPDIPPFGGIPELLGRLRARYHMGLLTDGFLPAQRLKLEALALERFLDATVFTEELGRDCWKPSPAGFEAIRGRFDVPHEACAYVADNPAKDFLAPNRLGWRTIQFLQVGQVHAEKAAGEGGAAQFVARDAGEVWQALLE